MPTTSRAWHLVSRPHGELADDDVALVSTELPDPGPGRGAGAQHLAERRPVHARPDERREVLRGAVRARPADGRRRGGRRRAGRGRRHDRGGRRLRAARPGLARVRRAAGRAGAEGRHRPRTGAELPRRHGHARPDGVRGPARGRRDAAGRGRVRLGRRRRRRLARRPDRAAQGRRARSSAAPVGRRRRAGSSTSSASRTRSTTRPRRSASSCARPRRTASTCTSTTSAATTSRPPSAPCAVHGRAALCGAISRLQRHRAAARARATSRAWCRTGSRCAASSSATTATCARSSSPTCRPGCATATSSGARPSPTASRARRGVPLAAHRRQHRQDARPPRLRLIGRRRSDKWGTSRSGSAPLLCSG